MLFNCKEERFEDKFNWESMIVTATAYNSTTRQTNSNPHITAFGDSIFPGLNYIAVSNDLLKSRLKYNTPVKIEGLDSIYFVKDRMHSRWKNRIDIYMGLNVDAAKKWGRKKVTILYGIPKDSTIKE
ncbi:3D domain-containing protein [Flavobacteriaceae bacterium XHP0103]|nr:3D domain-containing protein [Marixanthotalea marina]